MLKFKMLLVFNFLLKLYEVITLLKLVISISTTECDFKRNFILLTISVFLSDSRPLLEIMQGRLDGLKLKSESFFFFLSKKNTYVVKI